MEALLEQEKSFRLNGDKDRLADVLIAMVDHARTDKETIEIIALMSKKKGQLKEALAKMIGHAYAKKQAEYHTSLEEYSFRKVRTVDLSEAFEHEHNKHAETEPTPLLQFLRTLLSSVIEGKIYLEGVRVLVTDGIKQILLSQNMVKEALETIYSVNVETFSSLTTEDILKYQLEQMYLAIISRETEKASTLSKRLSQRHLEEAPSLKPFYLNRMIFVHLREKDYHGVSSVFSEIRKSEESVDGAHSLNVSLGIFYGILSLHHPYSPMLIKGNTESKLCPDSSRVLGEMFISTRLVKQDELASSLAQAPSEVQQAYAHYQEEIDKILTEHNIIVISTYYNRITIESMSSILSTPTSVLTPLITEMIRKKMLTGIVDQMSGTVVFSLPENDLEDWSTGIDKCLDLIIKISHNITKT
ncbi:26S proteasome regulatory subunit N5 [Nematocida displodere]|uniref:26S proteasome regulatory subunit N5 n=1 Tax=Nematocida displodere TaxID=1805483 RepID=A0A177EBJ4_9MICR|nr:26S proteasome regulatory subunit N5 [Nematocida displodere]